MNITVDVIDASGKLALREAVGDGHCEGYDFAYCMTIPDASMYIEVDGRSFIIKSADVIQAVIAAYINEKGARREEEAA
jgi:hypothetical protein